MIRIEPEKARRLYEAVCTDEFQLGDGPTIDRRVWRRAIECPVCVGRESRHEESCIVGDLHARLVHRSISIACWAFAWEGRLVPSRRGGVLPVVARDNTLIWVGDLAASNDEGLAAMEKWINSDDAWKLVSS